MRALDTNVIVRFLVADDPEQAAKVRSLFQEAEDHREKLFVSIAVILEAVRVLRAGYRVPRSAVLDAIEKLMGLSFLEFEASERMKRWVIAVRQSHLDPADLLIGQTAQDHGCTVTLTLDRKSARSELFELL